MLKLLKTKSKIFLRAPTLKGFSTQTPDKKFEARINNPTYETDEYKTFEDHIKKFNDKIYSQNTELTNKIVHMLENDQNSAKVFTVVNEINKTNLANTSQLLNTFLNQILQYNDSVRIFLKQQEKKKENQANLLPLITLALIACGSAYLYVLIRKNSLNYTKLVQNIQANYIDNSIKIFKINSMLPIYEDHKNITNAISFLNGVNHIVLIGPSGMGKSESVKHFCLTQNLKDNLTIYIDLNLVRQGNIKNLVTDEMIRHYKGSDLNNYNRRGIDNNLLADEMFSYLSNKKVCFVFDNYNHQRDEGILFLHSLPSIKKNSNWKTLVVADNNQVYMDANENDLHVKYLNFLQTRSFKTYLIDKINSFCKKKVEYAGIEYFHEENLNQFYNNNYFMSFEDLMRYVELNSSHANFLKDKDERLSNKLNLLKIKDRKAFDSLKLLLNKKVSFEWQKIPKGVDIDTILLLEKLSIIFSRRMTDYVILNTKLEELYHITAKDKI